MSNFGLHNKTQQLQTDHEHIYYNIRIDNPQNATTNEPTARAVYNKQTRGILPKQSDYEMAVEAFNIRAEMPIFVCPIVGGTNTIRDLTPYKINYRYQNSGTGVTTDYKEDLLFIPDAYASGSPARPFPKSPNENNGLQDFNTNPTYYNVNSIRRVVQMFNDASLRCFNRLNADHPGVFPSQAYLRFDTVTKLFSIVAPYSYLGSGAFEKIFISVDALFYKYIDSIPAIFNGYDLAGRDYEIEIVQKLGGDAAWALGNHYAGAVPVPQTQPPAYLIMEQEDCSRHLWSNIKQILITSASIAVRSEYMPFRQTPDAFVQREANAFNQETQSVVCYVDYGYGTPTEMPIQTTVHRDIVYSPRYYKYTDLVSNDPLKNINIEMFYVLADGRALPIRIPSDGSATLNLMFRRKN